MNRTHEKGLKALRLASALLLIIALLGLASSFVLLFNIDAILQDPENIRQLFDGQAVDRETVILFVATVSSVGIAESLLQTFAAMVGFRVSRGKGHAETCQVLGLALVGAAVVSSLATGLLSVVSFQSLVSFAASVLLPILYYAAARRATTETFWQGIKEDEPSEKSATDEAGSPPCLLPRSYRLAGRLFPLDGDSPADVVIVRKSSTDADEIGYGLNGLSAKEIRHCHADALQSKVVGTMFLPVDMLPADLEVQAEGPLQAAYVLERERLVFLSDDPLFPALFERYVGQQSFEKPGPAAVLLEFLRFTIGDAAATLDETLERLDRLEENTSEEVNEIPKDFEEFVMSLRRSLRATLRFYKQYAHMNLSIAAARSEVLSEDDRALFAMLADQAQHLADDTQDLLDYALQIKNLYQSKIDVRQNKVMQILTVVTSIFMPLTLITGWYGMNFKFMPELNWSMSYFVVIAVAVVIVTVEIIVFKRNKWF